MSIGQAGVQIGNACWELVCNLSGYRQCWRANSDFSFSIATNMEFSLMVISFKEHTSMIVRLRLSFQRQKEEGMYLALLWSIWNHL
ncbi:hypothetical protein BD560DRAFT_20799 [Blakeslea trispora]|nr:hypothetical protein BD560DRAFT_20799 [Blakeslea trispora]